MLFRSMNYRFEDLVAENKNYERPRCNSHREMNKENVRPDYELKTERGRIAHKSRERGDNFKLLGNCPFSDLPFKIAESSRVGGSRNLYGTNEIYGHFLNDCDGNDNNPITLKNKSKVPLREVQPASTNIQNSRQFDREDTNAPRPNSPVKPLPSNEMITPSQHGSSNSSTVSSGIYNSYNTIRVRQRLGNFSWSDKFPSYSGNVSLVRTSEYNSVSSSSKNAPFLGKIVVEQQKQIQALQQQLASLVETMKVITKGNASEKVIENINKHYDEDLIQDDQRIDCGDSFKNAARMINNETINLPLQTTERKKLDIIHMKKQKTKAPIVLKRSQVKLADNTIKNLQGNSSIRIKISPRTINSKIEEPHIRLGNIELKSRLSNIKETNESISTINDDGGKGNKKHPMDEEDWSMDLPKIYYNPNLDSSKIK